MYHMYHSELISMRLPTTLLHRLDEQRGSSSRASYIRHLIEKDLTHDDSGHEPPDQTLAEEVHDLFAVPEVPTGYQRTAESDPPPIPRPKGTRGRVVEDAPITHNGITPEKPHRHVRGERLDPPRWVKGTPLYSYRCKTCDHIMET